MGHVETPKGISNFFDLPLELQDQLVERLSKSPSEIPAPIFRERLSPQAQDYIDKYIKSLNNYGFKFKFALLGVGNIARSPELRLTSPSDIDLRIITNTSPKIPIAVNEEVIPSIVTTASRKGKDRCKAIERLTESTIAFAKASNLPWEYHNQTDKNRIVKCTPGGYAFYLDYYNSCPAFDIEIPDDLPLHISIAGIHTPALNDYLRLERTYGNGISPFALLYNSDARVLH